MSRDFSFLFRTAVFCAVLFFSSVGLTTATYGQSVGNVGISSVDANRVGLTVQWSSQVNVSAVAGKVVDVVLDVNEDRAQTFFELRLFIEYGGKREMISTLDNSAFGRPYGSNPALVGMEKSQKQRIELMLTRGAKPGEIKTATGVDSQTVALIQQEMLDRVTDAEEAAKIRQEILQKQMELRGREVTVELRKLTLPRSTLYATTSTGYVQALDADTGSTRWTNAVGNPRYPTIGIGASHDHVAVINGSDLYCLNAENGKLIWSKSCRAAVGGPPAVSKNFVFVPLVTGRLEAFPIIDDGLGPESFVSAGNASSRPTVTEDSVCWATTKGFFTVASNREVSAPHYRLKSGSPFRSSATAHDGALFIGASDGFAYGVDEIRGSLLWEFSTGQTIKDSLIPLGQYVFIITEEHKLFKLFAKTGIVAPGWSDPIGDIDSYVGASRDRLYLLNKQDQIVVLNQETGDKLGTLISDSTAMVVPNLLSDRLYVGNRFGQIQCLREITSPNPVFLGDDMMEKKAPGPDEEGSGTRNEEGSDTRNEAGSDSRN